MTWCCWFSFDTARKSLQPRTITGWVITPSDSIREVAARYSSFAQNESRVDIVVVIVRRETTGP